MRVSALCVWSPWIPPRRSLKPFIARLGNKSQKTFNFTKSGGVSVFKFAAPSGSCSSLLQALLRDSSRVCSCSVGILVRCFPSSANLDQETKWKTDKHSIVVFFNVYPGPCGIPPFNKGQQQCRFLPTITAEALFYGHAAAVY